jgi:hypothetical protein
MVLVIGTTLNSPAQSRDLPSIQENEHAQSVHDATYTLINTVRRTHCSHSDLLDTSRNASISGRYAVETIQDIPYNTVSTHIQIMNILLMGGAALLVVILSQAMGQT